MLNILNFFLLVKENKKALSSECDLRSELKGTVKYPPKI